MPADRPHVITPPVLAALMGLLTISLVSAAVIHGAGKPPTNVTAVATRSLRFEDRADGAVMVFDGRAAAPFQVLTGQNGFLRGTLRGMARIRHSEGLDDTTPFRLTAWQDGRVTLDDPATGRHVELEAFGPTNAEAFARFLPLPPPLTPIPPPDHA